MTRSDLAAQLCVAYADETCGTPTSWTFADEATSLDCMVALFFAAAWQRHNVVRALVVECSLDILPHLPRSGARRGIP